MKHQLFTGHPAHVTVVLTSMLVAISLILSACSDKSVAPAGQWVAKVNDHEITVHQVNAELSNAGPAATGLPADVVQRRMVDAIVERQLLVDAAAREKLDRAPEVTQAIEQARQQIIAQAYVRKTLGVNLAPSPGDISDYYDKNPDLFAKRKQLEMRQLSVDNAAVDDHMARIVDAARTLDDVEAAFTANHVKFVKGRLLRTGSDFPPPMRANMDKLLSGKPFVLRTGAGVTVATMSVSGEAPVSLQEATPEIAQYLVNARGRDATHAELTRLRKEAQIEYKSGYGPAIVPAEKSVSNALSAPVDRAAAGLR